MTAAYSSFETKFNIFYKSVLTAHVDFYWNIPVGGS